MTRLIDSPSAAGTAIPGSAHFQSVRLQPLAGPPVEDRTGDGESALLILTGTHDVFAGGGSWIGRGLRPTVFAGRPCGIFLPPLCPWRLAGGVGEALLVAARVPPPGPAQPAAGPAGKVLLPLAGSGKAYDPASGEWKRQEDFPLAPEAILPRRITVADLGGQKVEFVFPSSYKARALCAAETALEPGGSIAWPEWRMAAGGGPAGPWPHESLYFVRTEGTARVTTAGGTETVTGDAAVFAPEPGVHRIEAVAGRCYVAAFFAGPEKQRALVPG